MSKHHVVDGRQAPSMSVEEAAELLEVGPDGVRALITAGLLRAEPQTGFERVPVTEVKAFAARLHLDHEFDLGQIGESPLDVDPADLLQALDGRSADLARRSFDAFRQMVPEAAAWSLERQARFVRDAEQRFDMLLALTEQLEMLDSELMGDLREVGAAAAEEGTPLPHLLVVLRISRDLLVQTAIEVAEQQGRHWGLALSLVLGRITPAIDRLTDAMAEGYWEHVVSTEHLARTTHENVLEQVTDGVFEANAAGHIEWVNSALAHLLGRPAAQLVGATLPEIFDGEPGQKLMAAADVGDVVEIDFVRPGGNRHKLEVRSFAVFDTGRLVGYQGIVIDRTAARDVERWKDNVLRLITAELRRPLSTVLGLGATLSVYASDLTTDRVSGIGRTVHEQAERMSRLVDDLHDLGLIESRSLRVEVRPVNLASTVDAALVTATVDDVDIDVDPVYWVEANPRRLEQVIANLVERAAVASPVTVSVDLAVAEPGGVFAEGVRLAALVIVGRRDRRLVPRPGDPTVDHGLSAADVGLLVGGLVEAMGAELVTSDLAEGRVRHEIRIPLVDR